jgi:hypothetical protein
MPRLLSKPPDRVFQSVSKIFFLIKHKLPGRWDKINECRCGGDR